MSDEKSTTKSWGNENTQARNWAFVCYPESAPENWRDILQATGLEFAISPLHDKDLDPTEEEKKSHWHIIAVWQSGSTKGRSVKRITDSINAPMPIPLSSVKGYYRYLTHKDNPDKHQYSESDITTLNGFNIANHSDLTRNEINEIKKRIQKMIVAEGIVEYSHLLDILLFQDYMVEWEVASNHTIMLNAYLRSRRHILESRYARSEEKIEEKVEESISVKHIEIDKEIELPF